ncbi:hypothetical protein [Actinokineospora sp.]|uniref:hypothetical protein n=1 Tax=Actinokineospora sp. TaxID=1872133 RepID=UPI003D6B7A44
MPDTPGLDGATRVSKVIGSIDYPLITRAAVPRPDVALIGDAALTSDPAQGVGCGWAFQSAEWLVDAVAPALVDGAPLASGLRRYARARSALRGHQWTIAETAKGGPLTVVDRLMLGSAVLDSGLAAHAAAFVNRTIPLVPGAVGDGACRLGGCARMAPTCAFTRLAHPLLETCSA